MAKIIEKIVQQNTAPKSTNVVWDDGENLRIFRNGRWEYITSGDSEDGDFMAEVTYSELKELRDSGKLVAGMQYRITDYVTTTVQANTKSANHPFDLIVIADDESTLNEKARAIQHDGDDYFANSDLAAWEIWYCLYNDINRFAWADTENGKGVIYRMIDEFNNDVPYDFKNILYVANVGFAYNQWGKDYQFKRNSAIDKEIDGIQYYGWTSGNTPDAWSEPNCWTTVDVPATDMTLYKTDGSTISYGGSILSVNSEYSEKFTFNSGGDDSLNLDNIQTLNNTIEKFIRNDIQELNWNTFGENCRNNKIGLGGHLNIFGDNCYDNTLLGGDYIFGNGYYEGCYSNTFGNDCHTNTFGNNCFSNTFGNNCFFNTFGNDCHGNTFGKSCDSNSFGNQCYRNTFGNNCDSNSFGNDCHGNTFGNSCDSNSFGNACYNNSFGNACYNNSFGNDCYSNTFGDYYDSNIVENGVAYCTLDNEDTASGTQQVQYYKITLGVVGSDSARKIVDAERNRDYETTVAIDSSGNVKQFCLADIAQKIDAITITVDE